MKFTLGEVFGLTRHLGKLMDKELSVHVSYRLYKLLKECSEEMDVLEKTRLKMIDKYAAKGDGKEKQVAEENKEQFQEEFSKLLAEEVDIEFKPFSLDELGDIKMSPNDMVVLSKIFKEN